MPLLVRSALVAAAWALAACGGEGPEAPPPTPDTPPVLAGDALRERLPASVGPLSRAEVSTETQGALGAEVASAMARYADPGGQSPDVTLTLTDLGTAEMAEMMGHGWGLGAAADTDQIDGHPAQADEGPGRVTVRVLVAGRFLVEGEGSSRAAAEGAVRAVDLGALAEAAGQ